MPPNDRGAGAIVARDPAVSTKDGIHVGSVFEDLLGVSPRHGCDVVPDADSGLVGLCSSGHFVYVLEVRDRADEFETQFYSGEEADPLLAGGTIIELQWTDDGRNVLIEERAYVPSAAVPPPKSRYR